MKLYCIYDRVAQEAGPIFEAKNNGVALRMFSGVNLPGNADDFSLMCIGEFDHSRMWIEGFEVPEEVRGMEAVEA